MRIGIIGAGSVGKALAGGWVRAGHDVTLGVRSPDAARALAAASATGARLAPVPDAAAGAEVVVLATPWEATEDAIEACADLSGKVVVDCTNPLRRGLDGLAVGTTDSAGERVGRWAAGARVVKAFNTTGANNMENPQYGDRAASMFFCGDDEAARATVRTLVEDLGFEAVDCGPLRAARYLEPVAMLWIHLAHERGLGREIAFALLRR
jgi:NADPH-dependent F420 reductase